MNGWDDFAESYAEHAGDSIHNAHYDRPTVLGLLTPVNGRDVLDGGCGPGFYAEELLRRGARVTALDGSAEMVRLARRRLGTRAPVRHHDLARPLHWLADETFDLAVLALVIHHLDDRVGVLRELHRVLRPDGRLVVSTHHPTTDWLRLGGSYFDVEKVDEVWHEGEWPVSYWRQPLARSCEEFADAGFLIELLAEPVPTGELRDRDAGAYAELSRRPAFIAFRLVKAAGR